MKRQCPCACHVGGGRTGGGHLKDNIWGFKGRAKGQWRFRCAHCWSVAEWDLSVPIKGVEFTIL